MKRKLQSIGQSLLVTLPKQWVNNHSLQKGDAVHFSTDPNGNLRVSAQSVSANKPEHASIVFDKDFRRRFFKEYFSGTRRITITCRAKTNRGELYTFLQRFMNVQILEDTSSHVTLLCYGIDELGIQECLDRMYHVLIEFFVGNHSSAEQDQLEQTLTQFYNLLILQVRRFIDEGIYAQHNQISLLRAMDCRMVAEKIERCADLIREERLSASEKQNLASYMKKSYGAFRSENFQSSIGVWEQERNISVSSGGAKRIASLIRQISGFVR